MTRALLIFLLITAQSLTNATEIDVPINGGRSPDRQLEVVNINDSEGGYFVIRSSSRETIFSGKSLRDEFQFAWIAWDVLWRSDSRFVAISFHTTQVCVETVIFEHIGATLRRVKFPWFMWDGKTQNRSPYEGLADNETLIGNTHRRPTRWLKNGDLVMDITTGYLRKSSEAQIKGYFATVRFTDDPPKASVISKTKITVRSDP
jgi:hypothetical protein